MEFHPRVRRRAQNKGQLGQHKGQAQFCTSHARQAVLHPTRGGCPPTPWFARRTASCQFREAGEEVTARIRERKISRATTPTRLAKRETRGGGTSFRRRAVPKMLYARMSRMQEAPSPMDASKEKTEKQSLNRQEPYQYPPVCRTVWTPDALRISYFADTDDSDVDSETGLSKSLIKAWGESCGKHFLGKQGDTGKAWCMETVLDATRVLSTACHYPEANHGILHTQRRRRDPCDSLSCRRVTATKRTKRGHRKVLWGAALKTASPRA